MTVSKFKVGDRVYAPHFGEGIVTGIDESKNSIYPIHVKWTKRVPPYHSLGECFTPDGQYTMSYTDSTLDIVSMEEQVDTKSEKFKVGDHVFSLYYGYGVVEYISDAEGDPYPVSVHWEKDKNGASYPDMHGAYTIDGKFYADGREPERDILLMDAEDDESTVERMEDALSKKVEDAVNPSHYKVKGLPEAIDIINHLMHREQYEGFLWGNILKYAYRFGRKGDKAETAGKIAWYATQLKELEEEKRK